MLRQLDVVPGVIGEPDDPRMILRFAAYVPQLELLEPEHVPALPSGEPVRRRAAEPAKPEDDVFVILLHAWLPVGAVSSAADSPSFSPT